MATRVIHLEVASDLTSDAFLAAFKRFVAHRGHCADLWRNLVGLWEAGVKSTKHHLKRVIGNSTLTFEEMTTLLCQIEACLNSRPIAQISSNPEDSYPLIPGHFLVGEPLVLVPDTNYEHVNMSTLKRWHFTQRLMQDFWRR
ncbi:hypothetical protein PYW08_016623 [Mythimna loreyi]|uniref:Uncharacterized protein n=1 Tax=Mythimna loreyi TaxID=667449 RepID=A0ACC2QYK4_9NEOP|nr:hypothetical protein PYW08_016623 [Mythimna loreyi]